MIVTTIALAPPVFILAFGALYRIRPEQRRLNDSVSDRVAAVLAIAIFVLTLVLAWRTSPPHLFLTAQPHPIWACPILASFAALWALPKVWRLFVRRAS